MICEKTVSTYCSNYKNIRNFRKAVADTAQTYDAHHILEIMPFSGKTVSAKYLKDQGLYYNQPAEAFIFLTHTAHSALHNPINLHKYDAEKNYITYGNIRCIETGEVLRDIDWRRKGHPKAHEVARGWRKSTHGLHFEFV